MHSSSKEASINNVSRDILDICKENYSYSRLVRDGCETWEFCVFTAGFYEGIIYSISLFDSQRLYMDPLPKNFYSAALQAISPIKLEESYATVVKQAMMLIGGAYGSIFVYKNGRMQRVYTSYPPLYTIKPRIRGDTFSVFEKKIPSIVIGSQVEKKHPQMKQFGIGSEITFPLIRDRTVIGTLSLLSSRGTTFSNREMELLEKFTPFAAAALHNTETISGLQQSLESRDLFISMASHELKTPLTTINMYTQLLQRKLVRDNTIEAKWMDALSAEITRLSMLVNDLLRVETIENGYIDYRWRECSIQQIISRALNDFKLSYPQRVTIHDYLGEKQDVIWGDFDKLLQVIINILNNAAKFSPSDSEITIVIKQYYHSIRIEIHDQGKGISKKDLSKIFDKYFRGEMNRPHPGMGLGLFLAKNIVENHNGKIYVQSSLHKGTTFFILLPKYTNTH